MESNGKSPARRILLYGHDTFGLGHFRRNLSIAHKLADRMPGSSILCLTGSPYSHSFAVPPNFDCVRLPAATKNERGHYVSRTLPVTIDELTTLREGIIAETVRRFDPDVFLVDHSPLGMSGELLPTLERLRDRPGTRVVLGLRDIVDDPDSVRQDWSESGVYEALESLYDRVLVYGNRSVFDVGREYSLPASLCDDLRYTGYVYRNGALVPPAEIRSRFSSGEQRLVTVTVGGGGDGEHVIEVFLRVAERFPGDASVRGVVLAGPLMDEARFQAFAATIRDRNLPVDLIRFSPSALDLFAASDLVISMGGYNTLCEILALGRPSLVVPRVFPRREQIVRASRFEELGLVRMIHPDHLTRDSLGRSMEELLEGTATGDGNGTRLDFRGLDGAVDELQELLSAGPGELGRFRRVLPGARVKR